MSDWISQTVRSRSGWDHLETLVDVETRMAGTDGERRAAEATRDALAEAGARDAHLEAFPIQGWNRGASMLRADGREHECIALPRSPPDRVSADLVDLGHGLPADFEDADLDGNVVLVRSDVPDHFDRYIHRREKYYRAVEGGAVGFVYRNHVEGCLPPTGSVGTDDEPIGEVPAVGVSAEVGARLARRADGDAVTLSVDCETPDATSQNVHAWLGPETDEEVLVTSHVDAHDIAEGAMDNGAGTALVVQLVEALATREDDLDTGVHVVCYGAEEVGLVGSSHHATRADGESVKAVLNNDGVVRGRTLKLYTNGFDALADAAATVADRWDHPIATVPRLAPHSDHWPFVKWGIPGIHAMSKTAGSGRGWGHTHADTLDKLESRTLREQTLLVADLVVEVAADGTSIPHREPDEIGAQLEDEDQDAGMKLTGAWPYDD